MSDLGKYRGSNWLKGPYYPDRMGKWTIPGKLTTTPISRLPRLGTIGAVIAAGRIGWSIGSALDKRFGLSNRAANVMCNRTPKPVKWWIHKHF